MAFTKFKVQLDRSNGTRNSQKADGDSWELDYHPSLVYLRPALRQEAPPQAAYTNCSYNPTNGFDSDIKSISTATYLKSLTSNLLETISTTRDFSHPLIKKHVSPTFSAKHDDRGDTTDRENHLTSWMLWIDSMPDYRVEILDSAVEMHESGRKAKIWTLKRTSGMPASLAPQAIRRKCEVLGGLSKEGIGCVHWELQGQTWVCTRLQMMMGVSEFE